HAQSDPAQAAGVEWARAIALRAHCDFRGNRPGDVTGTRMVFDHLWNADDGGPGTGGPVSYDHRADGSFPEAAGRLSHNAEPLPRPWQAAADFRHAMGVFLVLTTVDHLGRRPANRDSMVLAAAERRVS